MSASGCDGGYAAGDGDSYEVVYRVHQVTAGHLWTVRSLSTDTHHVGHGGRPCHLSAVSLHATLHIHPTYTRTIVIDWLWGGHRSSDLRDLKKLRGSDWRRSECVLRWMPITMQSRTQSTAPVNWLLYLDDSPTAL